METQMIKDSTLGILFDRMCPAIADVSYASGENESLPAEMSKIFGSWDAAKCFCQLRAMMVIKVLGTLCTGKLKVTAEDLAVPVRLMGDVLDKISAVELHKKWQQTQIQTPNPPGQSSG